MSPSPTEVIVVVDDDPSLCQAVQRLLNASGIATQGFGSAEELLAALPVAGAVCVVSDYKLPALSGLQLLDELRSRGVALPPVVMTAHDSPELRGEAMRRGVCAYLPKPFRREELMAAIHPATAPAAGGPAGSGSPTPHPD